LATMSQTLSSLPQRLPCPCARDAPVSHVTLACTCLLMKLPKLFRSSPLFFNMKSSHENAESYKSHNSSNIIVTHVNSITTWIW